MKIEIPKRELVSALTTVSGSLPKTNLLENLSYFLFEIEENKTKVTTNNLLTSTVFDLYYGCKEKQGQILLPAKLLQIVKNLSSETVEIEIEELKVYVRGGTAKFTLFGLKADDFPRLNTEEEKGLVKLENTAFKNGLTEVMFASGQEGVIPWGCVVFDGKRMMASDIYRLAFTDCEMEGIDEESAKLIPIEAIKQVARNIKGRNITISWSDPAITFSDSVCSITSLLIDAKFPDVSGVIPKEHQTQVLQPDVTSLKDALQRAIIMVEGRDKKKPVTMIFGESDDGQGFSLKAEGELGGMEESIEMPWTGDPVNIICDARYLLDVLEVIDEGQEDIKFELHGERGALVFKWPGYYYLMLPIIKNN